MQYGVLWSLAVGEQSCLLWPAAVRALSRRGVAIGAAMIRILCPSLRAFYCIRGYNTATVSGWVRMDWRREQCWPLWLEVHGEPALIAQHHPDMFCIDRDHVYDGLTVCGCFAPADS
jgi:hypothetical protein